MANPHPRPWKVDEIEPWCVEDADGGYVCECDTPQVAAKIVSLANAEHTVIERSRAFVARREGVEL